MFRDDYFYDENDRPRAPTAEELAEFSAFQAAWIKEALSEPWSIHFCLPINYDCEDCRRTARMRLGLRTCWIAHQRGEWPYDPIS